MNREEEHDSALKCETTEDLRNAVNVNPLFPSILSVKYIDHNTMPLMIQAIRHLVMLEEIILWTDEDHSVVIPDKEIEMFMLALSARAFIYMVHFIGVKLETVNVMKWSQKTYLCQMEFSKKMFVNYDESWMPYVEQQVHKRKPPIGPVIPCTDNKIDLGRYACRTIKDCIDVQTYPYNNYIRYIQFYNVNTPGMWPYILDVIESLPMITQILLSGIDFQGDDFRTNYISQTVGDGSSTFTMTTKQLEDIEHAISDRPHIRFLATTNIDVPREEMGDILKNAYLISIHINPFNFPSWASQLGPYSQRTFKEKSRTKSAMKR